MCVGNENFFKKKENEFQIKEITKPKKFILSEEQKKIYGNLKNKKNDFSVSVIQGITGSGKTLVYFEKIKDILKDNNQVLILFPEIFLTSQIEDRFVEYFGFKPFLWHSKITPKKKRIIWQGVEKNKIKIIIGARSALLLPFKSLKYIVVDEEHDASYKQEEGPIYNARDMAILKASVEKIPINLVTSIPSVETYNHIKNKKYSVHKLNKRYQNYPMANTKIINLNLKKQKKNFISEETYSLINKYLDKKEQILFFLNRRGHSTLLICKNCGFKFACTNCSIFMTYHKNLDKLVCHYCGLSKKITNSCTDSKANCEFYKYGPGVEKIYEELIKKYPKKNIKIFSSDYLKNPKTNKVFLQQIEENKVDIIVGTQMISKGFNFKQLNCIVVVDADFTSKGYDLRSKERNIQLYNQLSGRAGRHSKDSLVIYQTITPTSFSEIEKLINNPDVFLDFELELRRENNLPPFKRFISLIISAKSKTDSFRGAQDLKNALSKTQDIKIMGPVESPMFRIKKLYRSRLLIKTDIDNYIQRKIAQQLENLAISSKIKLTVDVDPINFS